ncbi:hypothetical protein A7U43_21610 [Mycobacterium adipatum]|uniref:Uncharacterized protein n=1 Tax=Mycobacterium adipatum TaxID=1682113 RepID=A0A172UQU3_9MYCO|nr:hypothetical protein [Mycobacterium adipatum]ANE81542.1 hypothetical protein A7U43_21610 [Mycobacterium adipatum]
MSLVLGLSVTSKDIHGELVDGDTGEGHPIDRAIVDADHIEDFLAELPADADLRAVGITWSHDAETEAVKVREALDAYAGGAPIVAVRDVEATAALARGIADIAGHDFAVICVVEPDGAVVATVEGFEIHVEHIDHADTATLNDRVRAIVRAARPSPDAVYILGSQDPDDLVAAVAEETDRPVITATQADFALTRGAALASALAANTPETRETKKRITRDGALAIALGSAAVVFVVSLSVALTAPEAPEPPPRPVAAAETAPPPVAPLSPVPPRASREMARTLNIAPAAPAPPPPQAAAPAPPAAAPAPPPPPAAAPAPLQPSVPSVQEPRLRDRILDRIPIIGRFN